MEQKHPYRYKLHFLRLVPCAFYLNLAWRNIWRNKRRSLITISSILFAVFFSVVMRGFQLGSYKNMVDNVVQAYTGYIQVFDRKFQSDKIIENTILMDDRIISEIEKNKNVTMALPRLESFALASSGNQTKGVLVLGTDPDKDDQLTHLSRRLVQGTFLHNSDSAAIVSERLAKYLKVSIGDTLVLISQGFHGAGAAGKFLVKGILRFPSPDLDNKMVYLPLVQAQQFFSAENRVTSISLNLKNSNDLSRTVKKLQQKLGTQYDVRSWDTILVELKQQIGSDSAGGLIMLGMLYLIIGFGVFGTVQMMTAERRREFGVVVAVGMQKRRLGTILALEMLIMGLIGIAAGILLSIPVVWWGHVHPITLTGKMAESIIQYGMEPIMPTAWEAGYVINQTLVAMLIVFAAVILPVWNVTRLRVTKALRS
ncbi:MAG: ABC transporter permease [Porphyromonadaceae bacterium]|nr:MAG: ABC transporter permease [Porphyromonadaceae bacterium]